MDEKLPTPEQSLAAVQEFIDGMRDYEARLLKWALEKQQQVGRLEAQLKNVDGAVGSLEKALDEQRQECARLREMLASPTDADAHPER